MKMHKSFGWIMTFTLFAGVLAACSGGGGGGEGAAETPSAQQPSASGGGETTPPAGNGEKITLSYWAGISASQSQSLQTFNDLLTYQEMEKRTGVHIEFQHPAVGSEKEQFNLMIASGDLPDMIEYNFTAYPGGPEKALGDGILIELNDVIEQHAPNLKKYLDENPEMKKQVITDSGKMYVFPSIGVGNRGVNNGIMIRKDWLDDLGLANPVTIDDWTNVLRAFKNEKSASAPLTMMLTHLLGSNTFNSAFDVGVDFYNDNGTIKYGPIEPGFKEYLAQLNAWYEEGLFDPDFATQDGAAFDAKVINSSTGAFFAFIGSGMGKFLPALAEKDPKFTLAAAQYPVKSAGQEPRFITYSHEYRGTGSVGITTANENVEATAEWLDYFYSEEGHNLKSWGVEGVTFNWEGDFPRFTDLIMKNPDGLSIGDAMSKYTRVNAPAVGFVGPDEYIEQYYDYDQQKEAAAVYSQFQSNASETRLPLVSHTPEEANELATIMAEVNTFREEMLLKFVMGSEPIENFDAYVEQLKKMNIERAIELKAAAVERYAQR
ncbi:extracellular solute-binding protein [Paenibacillus antri]|uniref:Extracellular solute-binding protein n=1 Tax=Paenibacillus antri TaxID=2582848 RepID=A0A5R9G9K1_9BACL|nr:extracellular solute-binding protein [Paenibacillus antri]TLS51769.1 extracellular solute-binding protein [Paenibacillus antri]